MPFGSPMIAEEQQRKEEEIIFHQVQALLEAIRSAVDRVNAPEPKPRFITAEQIAEYLGVSQKDVEAWVGSGYMPHYFVGQHGPYFKKTEAKKWVDENVLKTCEGRPLPERIVILADITNGDRVPPARIQGIPGLKMLDAGTALGSGVYFLCQENEVVYVGQSTKLGSRICAHFVERSKHFDTVWFMPVPTDQLIEMEKKFIDLLHPKYNGLGEKKSRMLNNQDGSARNEEELDNANHNQGRPARP